jgi:hypothetical protein
MSAGDSHALHTITASALDPHFPLFRHYPAMKVGVRGSVRFYAELLAPLAEEIIAGRAGGREWVVTAPPFYVIPAGANLVASEACRLVNERGEAAVRQVDLRYARANPQDTRHVLPGNDYSSSGIDHRMRNRRALHEGDGAPRPDPADFRGRAVIFINDINVTGTQQYFIQRTLEPLQPASIDYLYIVQVEPDLGRAHPEIEYALNYLSMETFEEFADVVARADIEYTSRCVARLFGYPYDTLAPMLRTLDEPRRKRLRQLATDEGVYVDEEQAAKLALLG